MEFKKIKKHFVKVLKIRTNARDIALGFAIGTFIEIAIPLPFFDFVVAIIFVSIFRNISKLSLFGALVALNIFFTWPLFALSFKVGNIIFGDVPVVDYDIELFNSAYSFTKRFLVGNTIVAGVSGFLSYFVIKFFAEKYKRR